MAFSKNCEKRLLASLCLSVRPAAWNYSASTGRILLKFGIEYFFWKSVGKIQVLLRYENNNVYFACRPMHVYDISLNSP
jgi:hypothetical protein